MFLVAQQIYKKGVFEVNYLQGVLLMDPYGGWYYLRVISSLFTNNHMKACIALITLK